VVFPLTGGGNIREKILSTTLTAARIAKNLGVRYVRVSLRLKQLEIPSLIVI
jgi:hypothetical protein